MFMTIHPRLPKFLLKEMTLKYSKNQQIFLDLILYACITFYNLVEKVVTYNRLFKRDFDTILNQD